MEAEHNSPRYRILKGLPPYGPLATAFPSEWGRLGREGTVVEFNTTTGKWVANFRPGIGRLTCVLLHPNEREVLVISSGDLWIVEPESRRVKELLPAVDTMLEVDTSDGKALIFNIQGLALAMLGRKGLTWHTRRLSLDGLDDLKIVDKELIGLAWWLDEQWIPFRVDLQTGRSWGGSFPDEDVEGWEQLANE